MKRVRMAFYGINGTGLGHISRLLNIAREARELLHAMNLGADFRILTTSEAPQVAWDFPVWKMPSKTVVANMDTDNQEYAATSQFLISNVVAMMRPDILVMDTMPQGSFGEFVQLRSFCRKAAFINRHKDEAQARDVLHQSHLPLYDLILTPDSAVEAGRYVIPEEIARRNVFTGVIHGFRREEVWSREDVRNHFGIRPDQTVFYISAGGGGDKHAEAELTALIDTIAEDDTNFLLVGYGPLYRGQKRYRANVIPMTDTDVRRFFPGVDAAVSAAGYNTFEELLAARIPTAFYAQEKGMDRQDERIRLGASRGWNRILEDFDPLTIRSEIAALKEFENRRDIVKALEARGSSQGALRAAVELLRLHVSLPGSPVIEHDLFVAAALRMGWTEVAMQEAVDPESAREAFVTAARWVLSRYQMSEDVLERNAFFDGARQAVATGVGTETYTEEARWGCQVERVRRDVGCSARTMGVLLREYQATEHLDDLEGFADFCRAQVLPLAAT